MEKRTEIENLIKEKLNIEAYLFEGKYYLTKQMVADFYEVVDQTPPFTAHRYGWTDLRQADIASGRDGYYIRMPKPAPLD